MPKPLYSGLVVSCAQASILGIGGELCPSLYTRDWWWVVPKPLFSELVVSCDQASIRGIGGELCPSLYTRHWWWVVPKPLFSGLVVSCAQASILGIGGELCPSLSSFALLWVRNAKAVLLPLHGHLAVLDIFLLFHGYCTFSPVTQNVRPFCLYFFLSWVSSCKC